MRLIRLTTNELTGFFDNSFNEDIIIEPNSQICLSNLTAQIPTNTLIIDESNNTLTYQLQNYNAGNNSGGVFNIELENGTYGGGGISTDSLISQIQEKLNESLTVMNSYDISEITGAGTKEIGGQWKAEQKSVKVGDKTTTSLNVEYKMTLNKKIQNDNYEELGWTFENVVSTNTGIIGRDGGVLNTFDSYMYNSNYLASGGGVFRSRIHNLIDSTDDTISDDQLGIAIGFSDKDPATWIDDIDPTDYGYENLVCGVQVSKSTKDYGVINNEGWNDDTTGLSPKVYVGGTTFSGNDILQVGMNYGDLGVQIIQDIGTAPAVEQYNSEIFVPLNAPDTLKLYPIIFFLGGGSVGATAASGACRLGLCSYFDDPYKFPKTHSKDNEELGAISYTGQSVAFSNAFFNWASVSLSNHLGYNEVYYPVGATYFNFGTILNILGDRDIITDQSRNDNYIIELMNLKIQSYDGYSDNTNNIRAGRKSILATIPVDQDTNDILRFNASTPYFLNLDNKDKVLIRNLKVRILNYDYSEVNLNGLAVMTLLIKDGRD